MLVRIPSCLLLLGLALLGLGCFGGSGIDRDIQLSIHKESARSYYEAGDLDRAEDQALRGIALKRKDESLRLLLGWINLRRGTTDSLYKARGVFEEFARAEEPRADLGLGETLERLGRVHEETAVSIENGERFAPGGDSKGSAEEMREQADVLFREAIAAYQRVLDRQPDNLKSLNGMQRVHSLLDELDMALDYSDQLIEVASSERDALRTHLSDPGRILTDQREQGLRDVARNTEGLLGETHLFAYTLNAELGRPSEALVHLDMALELRPKQADIWSRRAQLQFELGNYESAIDDVMQFVRLSDKPFDDPDIRRAWELKNEAEQALLRP